WLKQGASLNVGASITTQRAHIRASITKHRKSSPRTGTLGSITRRCQMQRLRRQRAGPLRYVGPPRPGPLLNRPARGKMRTDSTYDWREIGEQVTKVSISMLIPNGASTDNARPPFLLLLCGLVEYCTEKHGPRSLLICEP